MHKAQSLTVFIIVLTILFGLLALPALASESKASSQPGYTARSNPFLSTSLEITFTSASTVYLPIVVKPPSNLKIVVLFFDAQDEYIAIKNDGPGAQLLDGWQIVSVRGSQIYTFPNGMILGAGQSVRVHSGPAAVNIPPNDLRWTTAFIWNNEGDKAELRDNQGALRDSLCYLSGCP